MTITRQSAECPALRQEETEVKPLGGNVIVRGLLLADRLELWGEEQPRKGENGEPDETAEAAAKRAKATLVERQLARMVILDDGQPLWTAEQWKAFGQQHSGEALRLYNLGNSFSGGNTKELEKN